MVRRFRKQLSEVFLVTVQAQVINQEIAGSSETMVSLATMDLQFHLGILPRCNYNSLFVVAPKRPRQP